MYNKTRACVWSRGSGSKVQSLFRKLLQMYARESYSSLIRMCNHMFVHARMFFVAYGELYVSNFERIFAGGTIIFRCFPEQMLYFCSLNFVSGSRVLILCCTFSSNFSRIALMGNIFKLCYILNISNRENTHR